MVRSFKSRYGPSPDEADTCAAVSRTVANYPLDDPERVFGRRPDRPEASILSVSHSMCCVNI